MNKSAITFVFRNTFNMNIVIVILNRTNHKSWGTILTLKQSISEVTAETCFTEKQLRIALQYKQGGAKLVSLRKYHIKYQREKGIVIAFWEVVKISGRVIEGNSIILHFPVNNQLNQEELRVQKQ